MSIFEGTFEIRNPKNQMFVKKTFVIYENLYNQLQFLSNKKYMATTNDLVIQAIHHLITNENIQLFCKRETHFTLNEAFVSLSRCMKI